MRHGLAHSAAFVYCVAPESRPLAVIKLVPTLVKRVEDASGIFLVELFKMDDSRVRKEPRLKADKPKIIIYYFRVGS